MEKVSLNSYKIPNVKYDLLLVGGEPEIIMEANARIRTNRKHIGHYTIQVDVLGYTDKDNPFMELSIIGDFSLSEDLKNSAVEEITEILKKEGVPKLYQELRKCSIQIVNMLNISFPQLPEVDFSQYN